MEELTTFLSQHLIAHIDTDPIDPELSAKITQALSDRGFRSQDLGHHIAVYPPLPWETASEWDAAVIYWENDILWIKCMALRWWELFHFTDDDPRYYAFWEAIDSLNPEWEAIRASGRKVTQGTVGELNINDRKKVKAK